MGSHAHPPLIRSPRVLLMGCWDGGGNRVHPPHVLQEAHHGGEGSHAHPSLVHPPHVLQEATRMERGPMLTHPSSTQPMFSRRHTRVERGPMPTLGAHPSTPCSLDGVLGWRWELCPPNPCSPGGTSGWRGVPCPPTPHPPTLCSPRGVLGWRLPATPACPMFSRTDAGNGAGHHAHSSQVLRVDAGMERWPRVLHSPPSGVTPAQGRGPTTLRRGDGMGTGPTPTHPTSSEQGGGMETGSSTCLGKPSPR